MIPLLKNRMPQIQIIAIRFVIVFCLSISVARGTNIGNTSSQTLTCAEQYQDCKELEINPGPYPTLCDVYLRLCQNAGSGGRPELDPACIGLLNFTPGNTQVFSGGLFDTLTSTYVNSASLTGVDFYYVRADSFFSASSFATVDWTYAGSGTLNTSNNLWQLTQTVPLTLPPSAGYLVAADFIKSDVPGGHFLSIGIAPCPSCVPTLSQWSLIILALLFLSSTMIFVYKRRGALAIAGTGDLNMSSRYSFFDKILYAKVLAGVLAFAIVSLYASFAYFGSVTNTDIMGTVLSSGIVAYMVHLYLLQRNKS